MIEKYLDSATTFAESYIEQNGNSTITNISDSRVYHITSSSKWIQKSKDHTLLNDFIDAGKANPNKEY